MKHYPNIDLKRASGRVHVLRTYDPDQQLYFFWTEFLLMWKIIGLDIAYGLHHRSHIAPGSLSYSDGI